MGQKITKVAVGSAEEQRRMHSLMLPVSIISKLQERSRQTGLKQWHIVKVALEKELKVERKP